MIITRNSTDANERDEYREHLRQGADNHHMAMTFWGASPAELQDIAWVTYLGNVYREENAA